MPAPEQGELVSVRNRRYVVADVLASMLPNDPLQPLKPRQHVVSLASVDDDGLGEELQVVWEIEPGAQRIERGGLPEPTAFDPPERLEAFLDAVRWGAIASANTSKLQSPFRAGIDREDYQLEPVARALDVHYSRILSDRLIDIADGIGIPTQPAIFQRFASDGEMFIRRGVDTALIAFPTRYTHSPFEMVDEGDLDACVRLIQAFLMSAPVLERR